MPHPSLCVRRGHGKDGPSRSRRPPPLVRPPRPALRPVSGPKLQERLTTDGAYPAGARKCASRQAARKCRQPKRLLDLSRYASLRPGCRKPLWFHQVDHTLDIPFLWGMSLSALDLVFLQSHQLPPLQLGSPLTALQSMACLLHWQVLLALAAHLSVKERDVLRCYLVSPPHYAAPSPGTGTGAASASAPAQRVQAAKTAAAEAHQECQRQMLKRTPCALPEAAPLGCAFSHTDYLSDAHFHLHWLVKERLPPQINRSVDLESLRQTFSSQEPSAIPLGTAVDSCLLEQSRRLPSTGATNSAVWLALGAHPNMGVSGTLTREPRLSRS